MTSLRERAVTLGAVLSDPASPIALALQLVGVDEAYECFKAAHPSIPDPLLERWRRLEPSRLWEQADAVGATAVIPGDPEWPQALDDLGAQRPWALWVRGRSLAALGSGRAVSIVGARSCTSYGERTAAELAAEIASRGHSVISGGAYGIDAAAHRGALAAGGSTIAVLACGVDVAYPSAHAALFERILEQGSLISEAAPGAHPTKPAFLIRNRLIAALGYGTVVVEARHRSGSISTYAQARSLNRILMAVPGPIDSPESAGTNALLQQDGQLVTSGADVLSLVAALGTHPLPVAAEAKREWDALTPDERHVHEALPARRSITVDSLLEAVAAPLSVAAVLAALARLAQRGIVSEGLDGSWRRIRRLRGAGA